MPIPPEFRSARRHRSLRAPFLATAAACAVAASAGPLGAQEASPYGRVIVFGDSISDGGAYGAKAPAGAGSFTTNPDPVWVEVIASGLGLQLTPHIAGGDNYAEGGARVAVERPDAPGDLPRTPVLKQVDAFLAGGGTFDPDALVIIQGGGNDVFATQVNGLAFTPADLAVLDKAAQDLAGQVKRIADAGSATLVTVSVPQFEPFNSRYRTALAAAGVNVLYFDVARLISEIQTNPAEFGILNTTGRACGGGALDSFRCLPQNYVTPDANRTYLFADSVHFTGVVHAIEGDALLATLRAPAQVGQLPLAAQAALEAGRASLAKLLATGAPPTAGNWAVSGTADGAWLDLGRSPRTTGLKTEGGGATLGAEYALRPDLSVGAAVAWNQTNGSFGGDTGGFDARTVQLTAFGRGRMGPFDALVEATYGDVAFDDIERRVVLGPAQRIESGDTNGRVLSVGAEVGVAASAGPLTVRPNVGLRYEQVKVGAYAELGSRSTQVTFGDQELNSLYGSIGADLGWGPARAWPVQPFARVSYQADLRNNGRSLTITPAGAPVSFTGPVYSPDDQFFAYSAGLSSTLQPGLVAMIGVAGTLGRGDMDAVSASGGLRMVF